MSARGASRCPAQRNSAPRGIRRRGGMSHGRGVGRSAGHYAFRTHNPPSNFSRPAPLATALQVRASPLLRRKSAAAPCSTAREAGPWTSHSTPSGAASTVTLGGSIAARRPNFPQAVPALPFLEGGKSVLPSSCKRQALPAASRAAFVSCEPVSPSSPNPELPPVLRERRLAWRHPVCHWVGQRSLAPARASWTFGIRSQSSMEGPVVAEVGGGTPASAWMEVGGQREPVEVVAGPGVSAQDLRCVLTGGPLKRWLDRLALPSGILARASGSSSGAPAAATTSAAEVAQCRLHRVLVQNVDYFGARPGFVKFRADIEDIATGVKLPGIVFARGDAVGVLMLLKAQDERGDWSTYALLTEQVRVPVGRNLFELPAGMLDGDGSDFVGAAAREVEEETGIKLRVQDLVNLTDLLSPQTGRQMLPSPGGCDEGITLFLHRAVVEHSLIQNLQGRETGLRDHGEIIRVHAVPLATLWRASADCKVHSALMLYENALREQLLTDEFLPLTP